MTSDQIIATGSIDLAPMFEQYRQRLVNRQRKDASIYNFVRAITPFQTWLEASGIVPEALTEDDIYAYFASPGYGYSQGDMNLYATAAGQFAQTSISFGYKLSSTAIPHFMGVGAAPTTDCPGNAVDPEAKAGHFCLYATTSTGFASTPTIANPTTNTGGQTAKVGALVFAGSTGVTRVEARGSWAVTAS